MSEQTQPFPFGASLEKAHLSKIEQSPEVMQKLAYWMKKEGDLFFFCGNVGTGKSYFASAFYNHLKDTNRDVRAITEHKLFSLLRVAINNEWDASAELERICDIDFFILDDMGSSTMTDWQKNILFEFVNMRTESGLPTLITSNLSRKEIKENFHERFESRIYAAKNTIIELNGEDRRQWKEKDGQ